MDQVGMNLTQGDQGPGFWARLEAERVEKGLAIPVNSRTGVMFCEAEVEITAAVNLGESAEAGAEAVYQARETPQAIELDDVDGGFWGRRGTGCGHEPY